MSKYVKYYYSDPVHFGDLAYNPVLDKTVVSKIRLGKRFTMAMIYDDDSQTIKFGCATCMPADNFDKKIGRAIAEKNAEEKPFHVITGFNGKRNDYADRAMEICVAYEKKLLKHSYPTIFNENYFID